MPKWTEEAALGAIRRNLSLFISDTARLHPISGYIDDVFELDTGEFRRLVATHLLLNPDTGGAERAIEAANELLRTLPSSISRTDEEMRGFVRGPVDWSRTAQRRYATGDRTLFLCRPPEKRYDTPLARLIARALRECAHLAEAAAFPRTESSNVGNSIKIQDLGGEARRLLRNPKLNSFAHRALPMPSTRTCEAVVSRRPAAKHLVRFIEKVQRAFYEQHPEDVTEVLAERLLVPDKHYKIFELQVGFRIVDYLRDLGFTSSKKRLLGDTGAALFAGRHKDGRTALVTWQRSTWGVFPPRPASAIYGVTRAAAKMESGSYVPDVIVKLDHPPRRLLVEAKLTQGDGPAAESQGITEMLAYLYDAESILEGIEPPHGLVVAWNSSGTPAKSKIMVSNQDDVEQAMDILLDMPHP